MFGAKVDQTVEEDSADPTLGVYLIDVGTGQVRHLVSGHTPLPERRVRPGHPFEPVAQRQKQTLVRHGD
jgi:hypothetical protein